MNVVFRLFTLALIITTSLSGIGGNARISAYRSWEIAQTSENINKEQLLEVFVPTSAIVRLTKGGSYTGELRAFNAQNLEITANNFSQIFSLSQIKQVEFQGDVWIVTPNGTKKRLRLPIRGITIPLEKVPVTAFKLENPPHKAILDLGTVLNEEEFDRLSSKTNKIHVVKKILFDSQENKLPETMTIRIVPAKR